MGERLSSPKLRLLLLAADKFPPFRVDLTVLFGREMVGRGHSLDWLLQSDKTLLRAYETEYKGGTAFVGATGTGPRLKSRIRSYLCGWSHDWKMFRLLRYGAYDLVVVKDKFITGVLAALAARLHGSRYLYWLSFPFDEVPFFRVREKLVRFPLSFWLQGMVLRLLLYRVIVPWCDHVLVQTEYMKSEMVRKGAPAAKMTAVPMAVSLDEIPFFGYPQKPAAGRHGPIIVYLGTLIKSRRMGFLLRAFQQLLARKSGARLYLVGGSEIKSDEEDLQREADELGIAQAVTITGFLPQPVAWQFVEQADVCVSPIYPSPIYDVGSPTKLLEYMAMGKAVVANDQPEQQVVLEESGAGLCVPWDEGAFCRAMEYLVDNPDEARAMGKRGREYVARHRNYVQTADKVESLLLKLASQSVQD